MRLGTNREIRPDFCLFIELDVCVCVCGGVLTLHGSTRNIYLNILVLYVGLPVTVMVTLP